MSQFSISRFEMTVTHQPDPIVDPERLFDGFENLMPFRVQDLSSNVRKKKQSHPERSGCFAKRSRCEVEGPRVRVGRDKCGEAFSQGCLVKIPCDRMARVATAGPSAAWSFAGERPLRSG